MPTVNEKYARFAHFIIKYILRDKTVSLEMVKASMLLSELDEKMTSEKFFKRPRYDIDLAFISDIKKNIRNSRIYLQQDKFSFESWMQWVGEIHLFSFKTQTDLINEYACAILFTMLSREELQKIHQDLQSNTSVYVQRIIALHTALRDDKGWEADIRKVANTTVSYAKKTISARFSK